MASTSSLLNDATPAAYPVAFAITIAVGGFTLRRPRAWVWGAYAALAIGTAAVLQHQGLLDLRRPPEAGGVIATQAVVLLLVAAIVHWVNEALDRARTLAAEVEAASAELMRNLFDSRRMEAIGRLAGGVAHDFNNLLTVVSANASFLAEIDALSGDDKEACDAILKAVESGAHLTRQLLTFGGRHVAQPERLDPALVIDDFRAVLVHMGRGAKMHFSLTSGSGCIEVDPGRLQHAVANLVVNAASAIQVGGLIEVSITADAISRDALRSSASTRPGEYMVVRVRDDGCGMDEETVASALEPFFTTREVGQGTGLGLAVVHGVVKHAGGHVQIESRPFEGTTVSLWFPRTAEAAQWKPEAARASVPEVLVGTRVLFVDDNNDVRQAVTRILTSAGAHVDTAATGVEALDLGAAHVYDVGRASTCACLK